MRGNRDDLEGEGGLWFGEAEGEEESGMDLFEGSLMGSNVSKGESSGCSGEELCDSQHKRAKVYFDAVSPNVTPSLTVSSCSNELLDVSTGTASDNHMLSAPRAFGEIGPQYPCEFLDPISDTADADNTSLNEDLELRTNLIDDLLHMVFSFLGHLDLCRAAMVCRQWRAVSAHEDFWRCLNFENRNISVEQFKDVCQRYPNATKVNITRASALHLLAMMAVSSLRILESLTLGKGRLGDMFFIALADCHSLKSLSITEATLGNGFQEITINHERLSRLELIKCRVVRISVSCAQLESLSLKRSNMAQAQLTCPLLRELDIGYCCKLSDAAIRSAAISCPLLKYLDMSNCSCVSHETLREIALTCGYLQELNASYCPNISLESVRLQMLTVLKLNNCEGITSASMAAISYCRMLEVLELDHCSRLTHVSLDLPRLRKIRLECCWKIANLSLRTLMLLAIKVSNCPELNRINISSNSLQTLALRKLESLTTLALDCLSLEEVDLTDCKAVTNSICDVFSYGGRFPLLRYLVLDNCVSLTAVRFCSDSLTRLSLAGCRAVTYLELACRYLQQVCLDGCDHLEKATFCPVGLRSLNLDVCPKLGELNIEAPQMTVLELKGCGVLAVASINCLLLTSLNLGVCPKLGELNIEAPQMTVLELKGCGVLADASIKCPHLTSLDFSFCSKLRDDCLSATAKSCPRIESLILMSCRSVGCDGLYSLSCLQHLTSLDLSYTFLTNLLPVFESCTRLKVLKLQACKDLVDSALEPLYKGGALPEIQELDLSNGTLSSSAIEELLSCRLHLTHVSLSGCVNMQDLDWGHNGCQPCEMECADGGTYYAHRNTSPGRSLQSLLCVACPNIKKVHIPPTARCCHLRTLNLSLSANLKEVDISCVNLSVLNFSNCCSLEVLKLECPKLASLSLQACCLDEEEVKSAISKCTMLESLDVRLCTKISSASMGRLRSTFPNLKRIFGG